MRSCFLLILLFCGAVLADPDAKGDYYNNETPVQGRPAPPLSPGSLWKVVEKSPCRKAADEKSVVVRTLAKGSVIEVEVWRGGSDEVLVNALDSSGRPWMPVRGKKETDVCYVRANSKFIRPVQRP